MASANPGEPNHERIASPRSGSAESAAGWRPREPPLIIVDPAFVLDRWRPTDSAALRRFDLDSDTARFFGYTVEQAQAMPDSHYDGDERARGNLRAWHAGRELNLAIRRRSDSEAVGWVELRLAGHEAEVSYNVTAELRRQGIASRALQAFLTWAAQQIGLRRARLACHIDNLASRRVAEKCGFVLLGQQGEEYRFRRHLDPAKRHATGTVSLSVRYGHRLFAMPEDPVDPEDCLRSLAAEALLWAPHRPLFPVSLGLMAVANAFVMLGLLPEPRAGAVLADHKSALERMGLGNTWGVTKGELTVRPGAHGYWQSRMAGPGGLREVPFLVAAAGVCCPTSVAGVCFEWVRLTSKGWQLSFRAAAPDPGGNPPDPEVVMGQAMSEISLTGDAGRSHDLRAGDVGWSRLRERGEQEWHGKVRLDPDPARESAWLEFTPVRAGASGRVGLAPPASVPVGTAGAAWPAPAECYLAELATTTSYSISDPVSESTAGPEDTAKIAATVADSLIAVGALPVTSALLREFPGSGPGWHSELAHRWGRRVRQQAARFRAADHRGLVVQLPLERATAVIESVSAQGELVSIQLYGHPWVMGEYWPMITPCFQVRAVDDAGNEHEGRPGDWQGFPGDEGTGSFWFWPPVPQDRNSIRVTVSTLWEAAWADIELPRRQLPGR